MAADENALQYWRDYARSWGLEADPDFDFAHLAASAANVAQTARTMPRATDTAIEPAGIFTVHVPAV